MKLFEKRPAEVEIAAVFKRIEFIAVPVIFFADFVR